MFRTIVLGYGNQVSCRSGNISNFLTFYIYLCTKHSDGEGISQVQWSPRKIYTYIKNNFDNHAILYFHVRNGFETPGITISLLLLRFIRKSDLFRLRMKDFFQVVDHTWSAFYYPLKSVQAAQKEISRPATATLKSKSQFLELPHHSNSNSYPGKQWNSFCFQLLFSFPPM